MTFTGTFQQFVACVKIGEAGGAKGESSCLRGVWVDGQSPYNGLPDFPAFFGERKWHQKLIVTPPGPGPEAYQ